MPVTADDLDAAVSTTLTTLRPATGRDWSVPAGALEWDCWHTAEHIGDCLLSYAGQLVAQPTTRFVRFEVTADKDASPAEVLEFAEAGGRILAATVRTCPPQVPGLAPERDGRSRGVCRDGLCRGAGARPRHCPRSRAGPGTTTPGVHPRARPAVPPRSG